MFLNVGAALFNRRGDPFLDDDKNRLRCGDIAMAALDMTLEGDELQMKDAPDKWVKAIMKRDALSTRIAQALKADGWLMLKEGQDDLLTGRLSKVALRFPAGLALIGPIMEAIENAPTEKPTPAVNGSADPAVQSAEAGAAN